MVDLITPQRAAQNAALAGLQTSNGAYFASIVTAASDLIRQYCARDFTSQLYSDYVDGGIYNGRSPLKLQQWPVTNIARIASDPEPVLQINYVGTTNQRATVETDRSCGLTANVILKWVASGVPGSLSLPVAAYPTIQSVATAINLQAGWQATAQAGYTLWATADLKPLQGAVDAISGATLELYCETIQPWLSFGDSDGFAFQAGWRLDDQVGELWGVLPQGVQNIWIQYTAGYIVIPQAVQEACVQLAQWMYQGTTHDMALHSSRLGPFSQTINLSGKWPASVMQLLSAYRALDRIVYR